MSEEKENAAEIVTVTELLATEPMTFYHDKEKRDALVAYLREVRENIQTAEKAGKKPTKKIASGAEKVTARESNPLEAFLNKVTGDQ